MKLVSQDEERNEFKHYTSNISYANLKVHMLNSGIEFRRVVGNHNLGYLELKEPDNFIELKRFITKELRQVYILIEIKQLEQSEIEGAISKILVSKVLEKMGYTDDSIVINSASDIRTILSRHRITAPCDINDRVTEYNIYFSLNGVLCRFSYDTREYVMKQLKRVEDDISQKVSFIPSETLRLLKEDLGLK